MNFKGPMSQPPGTVHACIFLWESSKLLPYFQKSPGLKKFFLNSLDSGGTTFCHLYILYHHSPHCPQHPKIVPSAWQVIQLTILSSGPFLVFSPMEMQSEWFFFFFYSSVFKPRIHVRAPLAQVQGPAVTLLPFTAMRSKRAHRTPILPSSCETRHLLVLAWRAHLQRRRCPALQSSTPGPFCVSASLICRASCQVILCFINNLTF